MGCHSVNLNQCQKHPFDRCACRCDRRAHQTRTQSGSPELRSLLHGYPPTGGCLVPTPIGSSTCGTQHRAFSKKLIPFLTYQQWHYICYILVTPVALWSGRLFEIVELTKGFILNKHLHKSYIKLISLGYKITNSPSFCMPLDQHISFSHRLSVIASTVY